MNNFNGNDALNRHLAANESYQDFLCHHGILGQKWGVRRYQNPDGTLTEAGKARYYSTSGNKKLTKEGAKAVGNDLTRLSKIALKKGRNSDAYKEGTKAFKTKWGEGQDGMRDWASEHKGATDKADKIFDKVKEKEAKDSGRIEFESPLGKRYAENVAKMATKNMEKKYDLKKLQEAAENGDDPTKLARQALLTGGRDAMEMYIDHNRLSKKKASKLSDDELQDALAKEISKSASKSVSKETAQKDPEFDKYLQKAATTLMQTTYKNGKDSDLVDAMYMEIKDGSDWTGSNPLFDEAVKLYNADKKKHK